MALAVPMIKRAAAASVAATHQPAQHSGYREP
jgi:hypothetical protein